MTHTAKILKKHEMSVYILYFAHYWYEVITFFIRVDLSLHITSYNNNIHTRQ